MSPQEQQILENFLNQLTQAHGVAKDQDAERLIARAVAQQPDAAYLLVQRALLVEQALNASKQQIATLQSQLQSGRQPGGQAGSGGFLDAGNAWGAHQAPASAPYYQQDYPRGAPMPGARPVQQAQEVPMQQAPTARSSFLGGGGGSGFLGNIAATAAGVAGGAFLFQGIESLMGHHGGSGFLGGGNNSGTPQIEETTVNNYYGSDPAQDSGVAADSGDAGNYADSGDSSYSDDVSGGDDSLV